ncbi:unnamed protein product [Gordionus sp. m RMFG-2023]
MTEKFLPRYSIFSKNPSYSHLTVLVIYFVSILNSELLRVSCSQANADPSYEKEISPKMGQHTPNTRFNKIQENVLRESGTITLADSPYYVSEDIIIPSKASVYIEPGVEIRFAPGVGIDVYGTLIAKVIYKSYILFGPSINLF